jgi:release factor glutamine methyltransferase
MNIVKKYNLIRDIIKNTKLDTSDIKGLIKLVTGFNSTQLIINDQYNLDENQLENLELLVKRRLKGEPFHYLLGYKEFFSREFKVTPDTLIPRPETELLVEQVLKLAGKSSKKVLELGTGSGCIAITCKLENPLLDIVASDNYPATLKIAKENAINFSADIKFIQSNWYQNINDKFDIIVSNPPYIAFDDEHLDQLQYEPQYALTDNADGFRHIEEIARGGVSHLNNGGYLLLEHGYLQGCGTRQILLDAGFSEIQTLKDYAGLDRISYCAYTF